MAKTGFRLLSYPEAQIGSLEANDFNDLADRKSRGTPRRDTASRKSIKEAVAYLDRNLPGLRRGMPRHEHLIGRVRSSRRPLTTAKSICRDYINAGHRAHSPIRVVQLVGFLEEAQTEALVGRRR
jgi:hypothetical protein